MEKGIEKNIKRIVLIGAESTGKTALTEGLSGYYKTVFVPEYAREYIENLNSDYTYNDVEHIAKRQVELEIEYAHKANEILFYDTYLIITKIWFKLVYNKIPDWINEKIENNNIDLFLLCNNDIQWIPDSVRENGGEMRDTLFEIYKKELEHYNCNFKIVSGIGKKRFNNALNLVNEFLD